MKILQIVQTLDPSLGGVTSAVLALSRGLARRGHKVDALTLDDSAAPWLSEIGLTVHALGGGQTGYQYSKNLLPWLREHGGGYDCVIVNGLWQYLGFAVWRRYAGTATPYYVFPHGMLDPWFKKAFPLKHLKKWLYWPWAEYRVLRDAAAVVFTSEEERVQARKSFWLYRCREEVSPLGVESPPPSSSQAKGKFPGIYSSVAEQAGSSFSWAAASQKRLRYFDRSSGASKRSGEYSFTDSGGTRSGRLGATVARTGRSA